MIAPLLGRERKMSVALGTYHVFFADFLGIDHPAARWAFHPQAARKLTPQGFGAHAGNVGVQHQALAAVDPGYQAIKGEGDVPQSELPIRPAELLVGAVDADIPPQ